jgi:hypothetical protein
MPTITGDMVKGGYQERGEKSEAPRISAIAAVRPPAIGPSKRLAKIIGILPKLIRKLLVRYTTKNLANIILIAANKAIRIRVLVFIFPFIKKFLPSKVITTLKRMEC